MSLSELRWWRRKARRDLSALILVNMEGASGEGDLSRMIEINMACDDLARVLAGLPSPS